MKIYRPEEIIKNGWPPGPWKEHLTPEELKEAYAMAREAFTAADLQLFTEIDEDIPIEEILAEMEKMMKDAGEGKP